MKQSIIFDLDGTLIPCENKQKNALFSILKSYGYKNPDFLNDWWELKRNGSNTETALIQLGIANANLISNEWKRIIEDFPWVTFDISFEDTIPTLKFLDISFRCKIYILTARKSNIQVFQTIQRLGFNTYIEDVVIVNPQRVIEEKTRYLKKINPLLYIGDTELDFMASTNAGTNFIALSRGQRSAGFLINAGVPNIEHDLKFLYDYIKLTI